MAGQDVGLHCLTVQTVQNSPLQLPKVLITQTIFYINNSLFPFPYFLAFLFPVLPSFSKVRETQR